MSSRNQVKNISKASPGNLTPKYHYLLNSRLENRDKMSTVLPETMLRAI
jgi:hypothetical protein